MAPYRLKASETLDAGIRRIASEQMDEGLEHLQAVSGNGSSSSGVHEARKNAKKFRGLIRLVRPALGDLYSEANQDVRDAARELSSFRDAEALLGTFEALVGAHADQVPSGGLLGVRAGLRECAERAASSTDARLERVSRAVGGLQSARARIGDWPEVDGFDVAQAGIESTYRRGRRGFARCLDGPGAEDLHEWRKRAKYLWYHARLLRDAAPSVLRPLASRLHDLSDALGDDHDLSVLVDRLQDDPDMFGGPEEVTATVTLAEGRQADLRRRCLRLGARLYAEKPKRFARRVAGYWDAWQEVGDELDVGEIGEIAPPDDDLEDLGRVRLYAMARKASIPGRSSMDRKELVAALRAGGMSG